MQVYIKYVLKAYEFALYCFVSVFGRNSAMFDREHKPQNTVTTQAVNASHNNQCKATQ
jgi:hypothetical protein